jgi:hypothetical protein
VHLLVLGLKCLNLILRSAHYSQYPYVLVSPLPENNGPIASQE